MRFEVFLVGARATHTAKGLKENAGGAAGCSIHLRI